MMGMVWLSSIYVNLLLLMSTTLTPQTLVFADDQAEHVHQDALKVLTTERVAVFIVAYNASKHIEAVLNRIPPWVSEKLTEIFLIDDSSKDNTAGTAAKIDWPSNYAPLKIFKTPFNQGYGGNQKIGYSYAMAQGFDIVVLLHGDGQYAPEALPYILAPYAHGADAVFGSRFLNPKNAIKGGMPLYKFIGNRILTAIQNWGMSSMLSEWHSGYRSYRVKTLKAIPFHANSNDFEFDSEIIIQTLGTGHQITEVPIPTFYGDEICHVDGIQYAMRCMQNVLQYRFMQLELFYDPKFDLKKAGKEQSSADRKQDQLTLEYASAKLLTLVSGKALDLQEFSTLPLSDDHNRYDAIVGVNWLSQLPNPEESLNELAGLLKPGGLLLLGVGNVAYLPVRMMLLLGFFNYGRRGILDKTHKRLFTKGSVVRMLKQANYEIDSIEGFGPPLVDLQQSHSMLMGLLNRMSYRLARLWPSLFAFQFLVSAKRRYSVTDLVVKTTSSSLK